MDLSLWPDGLAAPPPPAPRSRRAPNIITDEMNSTVTARIRVAMIGVTSRPPGGPADMSHKECQVGYVLHPHLIKVVTPQNVDLNKDDFIYTLTALQIKDCANFGGGSPNEALLPKLNHGYYKSL